MEHVTNQQQGGNKSIAGATGKNGVTFKPPLQFAGLETALNDFSELNTNTPAATAPFVAQRVVDWGGVRLDWMRVEHTDTDFTLYYDDQTGAGEVQVGTMNLYADDDNRMWLNNITSTRQRIGVGLALLHAARQVHGAVYAATGMRNDQEEGEDDTRHLSVEGAALVTSAVRNGVMQRDWCFNPAEANAAAPAAAAAAAVVYPVNNRVLRIAGPPEPEAAVFAYPAMPDEFTSIQVCYHRINGGDGVRFAGVILNSRNDENTVQSEYPANEGPDFASYNALRDSVMAHYNILANVIIPAEGPAVDPRPAADADAEVADAPAEQQAVAAADAAPPPALNAAPAPMNVVPAAPADALVPAALPLPAVVADPLPAPPAPDPAPDALINVAPAAVHVPAAAAPVAAPLSFRDWMRQVRVLLRAEYGDVEINEFPDHDFRAAYARGTTAAAFYAANMAGGRAYL